MASSAIDIEKSKISKMSEIDLVNSGSGELITGFSTPPSSSLDNCDSGFNDLYSNNFSLLSSGNMKCAHTTPAQTDQSDSSPESAQLFDDNSTAGEFQFGLFLLSTFFLCGKSLHSISNYKRKIKFWKFRKLKIDTNLMIKYRLVSLDQWVFFSIFLCFFFSPGNFSKRFRKSNDKFCG